MTFDIDENNRLHAAFSVAADGKCEYTSYEIVSLANTDASSPLNVWQP
jgi:hypothetical protein